MCASRPSTAISARRRILRLSSASSPERNPACARMAEHPASASDRRFLAAAIRLGSGALGTTWPNPGVGAILVKDGRVVGRGRTAPGGRPHGETIALAEAGTAASGATLYV